MALCLGACVNNMTNDKLNNLTYGQSPAAVAGMTGNPAHTQFHIKVHGSPVLVQVYSLVSGDYASDYFLTYQNGRLIFWGYPNEYARDKSNFIRSVGRYAVRKWHHMKDE